ncbi:hypothetical protein SASPL_105112 [Salvia splendens]|uniref:Uncharacterized protein n=1 Tax=Salvia splendens TaxID=180675 RepID=A0A8X9A9N9_SALSN|nr:UPF0481 protein At3g47200-like isoform X2 [Salvia splendens]KAG6433498.1 hypothetical protein SASPL_105112 [Salvia splendens]
MRDSQWIVEFNDTTTESAQNWATNVKNDLSKLAETRSVESMQWAKQSIYRIPRSVKDLCSGAYQPQTVSIGLYHHGDPHLQSMERHKHRALLTFLERSKKPLRCYLDALSPAAQDLRHAYHHLEPVWKGDTEAFLRVMIVDGCFILEIMRTATAAPESVEKMGYVRNDPVFSSHGALYFVPYIKRDMLMLENQIPLLALAILFVAEDDNLLVNGLSKLSMLILNFFSHPHDANKIHEYGKCLHILDLCRQSMLMRLSCQKANKPKNRWRFDSDCLPSTGVLKKGDVYIRSAMELTEAGIQFKQSRTRSLNDISFQGGVLRLPQIMVDDALESEYLNMIAFERFHVGAGSEVTSFVFFMDGIIDSARDVGLLHSRGIIQNALGSDKAVADLFNSLSRDVSLDPESSLAVLHQKVVEYCGKPLPRWMAYAKHNYFTNPWVGLSIVAAIFLFALTGIQTVYTVLGYYHSK